MNLLSFILACRISSSRYSGENCKHLEVSEPVWYLHCRKHMRFWQEVQMKPRCGGGGRGQGWEHSVGQCLGWRGGLRLSKRDPSGIIRSDERNDRERGYKWSLQEIEGLISKGLSSKEGIDLVQWQYRGMKSCSEFQHLEVKQKFQVLTVTILAVTLLVSDWSGLVIKACGILFCGTVLLIGTVEVSKGIDRNWGGEENMSWVHQKLFMVN